MTKIAAIRNKFANEKPVLGVFQPFGSEHITEMLGYSGFDFVVFDTEHGNITPSDCENHIRAALNRDIAPMVRVINNDKTNILKSLDRGSLGTLVPMVNTKEDAQNAVDLSRYYPLGKRGLSLSTMAGGYGRKHSLADHIKQANEDNILMVQIETVEAVKNIDEILSVDYIDVFFIGPSDLSQSMGKPGQAKDPEVMETIESLISKIRKANKIAGIFVGSVDVAKYWIDKGVGFVAFGVPGLIYNGFDSCLKEMGAGK